MKLLLKTLLISCLAATISSVQANSNKQYSVSKAERQGIHKQHNKHWQQKHYTRHTKLYQCFDSWSTRIRGKFVRDEKYLIELGGGHCKRFKPRHHRRNLGDLSELYHYDFDIDNVRHAVKKVKNKFGIHHSKLIEAVNVEQGFKTFKYTLVFRVRGQGVREFRVKHDYRNGRVKKIREV